MARYTASVIFADGDQYQTVASGSNDDGHTTGVLRMEAVSGMRELLNASRYLDPAEAAEVAEALDRMDDQ